MTTVLFACVHNAGRSQMAAGFFNALADPDSARAISAGTQPAGHVHPEVLGVMREVGIDLSHARPQRLTDELARSVQVLVTMGCGEACPFVPGVERVEWEIADPKGQPIERVRSIRDTIRVQVEQLIAKHAWGRSTPAERLRVLFLCTHNAARSQMAEALLRHLAGDHFEIFSAGLEPTDIHPLTLRVLEEHNVPTVGLRAKGVRELMGKVKVDYAIGVCDPTEVNCPRLFPFALNVLQWPFEDPVAAPAGIQLEVFRRVRDSIEIRLKQWRQQIGK